MKTAFAILLSSIFLFTSCSSANRIYIHQDDYKEQSTYKLNQSLKGYSDERKRGLFRSSYHVTFKHFYSESAKGETDYILDIKLNTRVRAYELEPVLYISTDGEKTVLKSEEQITKLFQAGSSSTSSETSSSTSKDPDNEGKETTETTTTYTTTNSHDTYQLMQFRLHPDLKLMQKISKSSDVEFKLYIANEGIEIPFRWRYKKKFTRYMEELSGSETKHF